MSSTNHPPNPAKVTDSRFEDYRKKYGDESWELDALPPDVLTALIRDELLDHCGDAYMEAEERENQGRRLLQLCSEQWESVVRSLKE